MATFQPLEATRSEVIGVTQSGWMHRPRRYWLDRLQTEAFDLVIIGGGITGAGIAREASLAGLRVALVEAFDFASGTSSRSTKLVHGGLRYLAQGHIRLVREAGSERAILRRLVPYLVHPVPFLLPIYEGMQHGLAKMSVAVWLYDLLAGVKKGERRKVLSAEEIQKFHPGIGKEGLRGGVLYHEYVTDDARLTLATLQSATEWGAVVLNDCPVSGLIKENGSICGVTATDRETRETVQIRGRVVVNAAGPWIEQVMAFEENVTNGESAEMERLVEKAGGSSRVTHSRGIHLSFSARRLKLAHALAVQTSDGRLVFLIPKGDIAYVGTTDKRYHGDLHQPEVPPEEVDYLLAIVNQLLPLLHLDRSDITGIWSGVRPLVAEKGGHTADKDTKDVSREDEIWVSPAGFITIAGGKLTAYRKMAERVLDTVWTRLGRSLGDSGLQRRQALSAHLPLYGAKEIPLADPDDWLQQEAVRLTAQYGIARADSEALLRRYGDQAETVLRDAESRQRILAEIPLLEAEIPYMIQVEMARHVSDVISRRTELGRFQGLQIQSLIEAVAIRMQALLHWPDEKRQQETEQCLRQCYVELEYSRAVK